jgi:CheY-like chemotaxis protein
VDDDADLRTILVQVLSARGFVIEQAADGREALLALRRGFRPALILLDLMMPRMDGWQFLAEQRTDPALADLPVLVMSAGGALRALPVAPRDYLAKPVSLASLVSAIAQRCRCP